MGDVFVGTTSAVSVSLDDRTGGTTSRRRTLLQLMSRCNILRFIYRNRVTCLQNK
jgi:hypothetical protein